MSHAESLRHAVDAAKAGNPALARVHLHKAAKVSPDEPMIWLWLAWLAESPFSMVHCLETALRFEPGNEVARVGLEFARGLADFSVAKDSAPESVTPDVAAAENNAIEPPPPPEMSAGPNATASSNDVSPNDDSPDETALSSDSAEAPSSHDSEPPDVEVGGKETAAQKSDAETAWPVVEESQATLEADVSHPQPDPAEAHGDESHAGADSLTDHETPEETSLTGEPPSDSECTGDNEDTVSSLRPRNDDVELSDAVIDYAEAESSDAFSAEASVAATVKDIQTTLAVEEQVALDTEMIADEEPVAVADSHSNDPAHSGASHDSTETQSFWTPPQPTYEKAPGSSTSLWNGIAEVTQTSSSSDDSSFTVDGSVDDGSVDGAENTASALATVTSGAEVFGSTTSADAVETVAESTVSQGEWPSERSNAGPATPDAGSVSDDQVLWRAAQSDWFQMQSEAGPSQATTPSFGSSPATDKQHEPSGIDASGAETFNSPDNAETEIAVVADSPQVTADTQITVAEPLSGDAELNPLSSAHSEPASEVFELAPMAESGPGQTTVATGVASPGTGRTVLVVDDSPTVRKLVAMTLEKQGFNVVSAFDGVAAIREIASHNPSLILMDVNMPRLDGYQLCKLVRKHESTQHIPVLMMTGKDGMFDKLRGRLVGCSGYISKPFAPEELVKVVEQLFGQNVPAN